MLQRFAPLLLLLALPSLARCQANFAFFEPVQPSRKVQIMAHRGMATLAPENSREAVLGCAADFVEWAEIDVRLSRDGKHIVLHDGDLERTTDGRGKVSQTTLEDLKRLDAGAWFAPRFKDKRIQTLTEILLAAKGKVNLYLDCKEIDPELLVKEIADADMRSQVIVYQSPAILARVRKTGGDAIATMTKFRPMSMKIDEFLRTVDPAAVEIDADDVTEELCRDFHRRGVKVQAKVLGEKWDNPETWKRVIDAGVDWLQTDDPVGVRFHEVRRRVPRFPVRIACHRGANRYAPENTLPAIRRAVGFGADFVEIDIRTTKDGQFVLLHDRTLDRTTDGRGPVAEMTLESLKKLDAGARFGKPFVGTKLPTLDEALAELGPTTHIYLDAKEIAPEDLLKAIRKHDLMDRHVVYQSVEYLRKLKALEARVRPLPPLKSEAEFEKVAAIEPHGFDASWSALSKEMIDRCHTKGIKVFSDALGFHETIEDYRKAIRWGIDAIQTDYPLRVLRAIELEASK